MASASGYCDMDMILGKQTGLMGMNNTIEAYDKAFQDNGGKEYLRTRVIALVVDGGTIVGVQAEQSTESGIETIFLKGEKGVALCTGGFAIGYASSAGKSRIHTAGAYDSDWLSHGGAEQDAFLESMAEAAKSVVDYAGTQNIAYVNVMNRLSVDCDCDPNPREPTMADIGILASVDPVALDCACADLVYAASDGADLVARIDSLNGWHTLEYGQQIGLGSMDYTLISIA